MGCDDESVAKQCGCRGEPVKTSQKENKGQCSGTTESTKSKENKDQCSDTTKHTKSEFKRTPCKEPKRKKKGKGQCHESHEKFKQPGEEIPSCNEDKNKEEQCQTTCHSSYENFNKNVKSGEIEKQVKPQSKSDLCSERSSQQKCKEIKQDCKESKHKRKESKQECKDKKTGNDCRDAYKKFILGQLHESCFNQDDKIEEKSSCQKPKSKSDPCSERSSQQECKETKQECKEPKQKRKESKQECNEPKQKRKEPKQDCNEPKQKRKEPKQECKETKQECKETRSTNKTGSCCSGPADKCSKKGGSSKESSSCDSSIYSKIKSCCKDIAKGLTKQNSHSKCSSIEETPVCSKVSPPSGAPPCPPTTEKGVESSQPCCTKKMTCAEKKVPTWADFFPLDARNKKLNECIEKYSKIDPSLVISKCSQFATATLDTSERCLKQMKKAQDRCIQGAKKAKESGVVLRSTPMLLSPKSRQLMKRWAPSAGAYLTTSALALVYFTEWKAVLKYVPLYGHLAKEEDGA